jgi:hypothetical protein
VEQVDAVTRRIGLALLVGVGVLVTACGSGTPVRDFLSGAYNQLNSAGDVVTYQSGDGVGPTAQRIAGSVPPAARASDAGTEYLRYNDDLVVVQPAGGQSNVRVEDLDGDYSNGRYSYLGSGFDPGSPAGDAGDDDDDAK